MRRAAALVAVGTLVLAACGASSSGNSDRASGSSQSSSVSNSTTTPSTVASPRPSPTFGGTVTLQFAYQHADGFKLDPIDLSPQILGGDHVRAPLDTANWLVIGQCPPPGELVPRGEPVRLGVLKLDEVPVGPIRGAAVSGAYNQMTCDAQPVEVTPPTTTAQASGAVMPNVVCMSLQEAQDRIQDAGVFYSRSKDGTGQGRSQFLDSNWVVTAQTPAAGAPVGEGEAVLTAVKYGEQSPC